MRARKSVATGAFLLLCGGIAEAGFFESLATPLAENKAMERGIELYKKEYPKGKIQQYYLEKYIKALKESEEVK